VAGTESLAEFAEEWWRVYAKPNLERNILKNYAQLWNKHALPRLGDLRLRDVTPRVVADFRLDLERAGVAPAAVRKTLAVLQSMLQRAVEWERIRSNPVRAVRRPSARRRLAVRAGPPEEIERVRAELELRDATLVSPWPTPACGRRRRSRCSGGTSASARSWSSRRAPTAA